MTAPGLATRYAHRPRHAARADRWPWWPTLAAVAVVMAGMALAATGQHLAAPTTGHLRPMTTTSTHLDDAGGTTVTMPMNVAKGLLNETEQRVEAFRVAVAAAASGPRAEAHQKLSAVYRSGYELQRVRQAMGQLEELNELTRELIAKAGAVIVSVREASGG